MNDFYTIINKGITERIPINKNAKQHQGGYWYACSSDLENGKLKPEIAEYIKANNLKIKNSFIYLSDDDLAEIAKAMVNSAAESGFEL